MKQRINGRKVINWHRPLRKNEFSQRYLRLREAPAQEDLDIDFDPFAPEPCSNYCICDSCFGYKSYDYREDFKASRFDQELYAAKAILARSLGNQLQFLVRPDTLKVLQEKSPNFPNDKTSIDYFQSLPPAQSRLTPKEIGPALAAHKNCFLQTESVNEEESLSWLEELENDSELSALKAICSRIDGVDIEGMLCVWIHKSFWVRKLGDWIDPGVLAENRTKSLLEHLFVIYPVPDFFYSEWRGKWKDPFHKWMQWFILLAQGGSLHRESDYFEWNFSRALASQFLKTPADISPVDASLYSEVARLGGNQIDFRRLKARRAYIFDPTEFNRDQSFLNYWRNTVRWLILNRAEITDGDANGILSWALHMRIEADRWNREPFSLVGRSVARVMDASITYIEQLALPYSKKKWKAKGWNWEYKNPSGKTWTMEELLTGKALVEEGRAMRHCVGGYAGHCYSQRSAIFSLKCEGKRVLTIEVSLRRHVVSQAYGVGNRQKTAEEHEVLEKWWEKTGQTPFTPPANSVGAMRGGYR